MRSPILSKTEKRQFTFFEQRQLAISKAAIQTLMFFVPKLTDSR